MPLTASLPVRVAIVAAFPVVLLALGFFPRSDLEAARARFSALRSGDRRRGGSS
jgi:hypothetical protein